MDFHALIIDADAVQRRVVRDTLRHQSWKVGEAGSAEEAMLMAGAHQWRLVFCDAYLQANGNSDPIGLTILGDLKRRLGASVQVVIMAAHGNSGIAVEAILNGALDYIAKPCDEAEILDHSRTILDRLRATQRETPLILSSHHEKSQFEISDQHAQRSAGKYQLVGHSKAIIRVLKSIAAAVGSEGCHCNQGFGSGDTRTGGTSQSRPRTFLLTGETGTGKELAARLIHQYSNRAGAPFIPVNCSNLTVEMADSELFGHERGAFTGAVSAKPGAWELADGGTLFLDEITQAPPLVLPKLLRALQDGIVKRIGARNSIQTDVQVIAATNHDLATDVRMGRFPRDLYYRINLFPIDLPPLRERAEDIPLLVEHFARKYSGGRISFSAEAVRLLQSYWWMGNIRELENEVLRFISNARDERVLAVDISAHLERLRDMHPQSDDAAETNRSIEFEAHKTERCGIKPVIQLLQCAAREALKRHNGNKSRAAQELGISRPSLYKLIRQGSDSLGGRESL